MHFERSWHDFDWHRKTTMKVRQNSETQIKPLKIASVLCMSEKFNRKIVLMSELSNAIIIVLVDGVK